MSHSGRCKRDQPDSDHRDQRRARRQDLGHVGDIQRFPSADHLASYAATAPIEASSGDVVRHRLSRRGNRRLNNAIHLAAHVQTIFASPGRDYYQRGLAAGNSRTEALRLLKWQLTKAIHRTLTQDAAAPPITPPLDIEALSSHAGRSRTPENRHKP